MKLYKILFLVGMILLLFIANLSTQAPDTLWTKTYGGIDYDHAFSVQQTFDGGYIIAGHTYSFGLEYPDLYLVKTDSSGDTIWTKTYGGSNSDYGNSVRQTSDGGYIIAGTTQSFGSGNKDVYLIRTDLLGDTIWTKTFGGSDNDFGSSVYRTTDGGYIIAGWTNSFGAGLNDVYLIKTEPDIGVEEKQDLRPKITDMKLPTFPNPYTTSTTIHLSGIGHSAKCIELKIYDISGRLVKSIPLTTNHLSLGTDLSVGIYFLKLNSKPVGKVVKVR